MSRKEASNTFTDGMIKDLNPINTPKTALTDCVNGTIITYDGNEFSLQNDKGNYPLKNCKLKSNYIPVGLKEYGDILYIVSYNPLDEHVEIGSYPSPETIKEKEDGDNFSQEVDPIYENIDSDTTYTEITETMQGLKVYYGSNPNDYKLNPGDKYKLTWTNKPTFNTFEELKYFIIDEDRKSYDVTDKVLQTKHPEDDGFSYIEWDVPGWFAIQPRWAELQDFDINVKKIVVPSYGSKKVFLKLNVQALTSDKLFINNLAATKAKLKANMKIFANNESTPIIDTVFDLNSDLNLKNGNYAFYSANYDSSEDSDWDVTAESNFLNIEITPYLDVATGKKVIYDTLKKSLTFNLNQKGNVTEFDLGNEAWWYNTDVKDSKFNLMFNTQGLAESSVLDQDVYLFYSLKRLNGTAVKANVNGVRTTLTNIRCDNWNLIGETNIELNFDDFTTNWSSHADWFYAEDCYYMQFDFYDKETITSSDTPLKSIGPKFITATQLMNNIGGTKYDLVTFDQWISRLKEFVTNKAISVSGSLESTPVINNPVLDEKYNIWAQSNGLTKYKLVTSEDVYEDYLTEGFDIVSTASCSINLNYGSDVQFPVGPLWINLLNNAKATFRSDSFNSSEKGFSSSTGKLSSSSYTNVVPKEVNKRIHYYLNPISIPIEAWDYTKNPLLSTSFSCCGSGNFTNKAFTGGGGWWEVTASSVPGTNIKSKTYAPYLFHDREIHTDPDGQFLSKLNTQFLKNDVLFITLQAAQVAGSWAAYNNHIALLTNSQNSGTAYIWHDPQDATEEKHFVVFRLADDRNIAIIHIQDDESLEDAVSAFNTWKDKIDHLICSNIVVNGRYYNADEGSTITDNSVSLMISGNIDLNSFKYTLNNTTYDLLTLSGRNSLASITGTGINNNFKVSVMSNNSYTMLDSINLEDSNGGVFTAIDFSSVEAQFQNLKGVVTAQNNRVNTEYGIYSEETVIGVYRPGDDVYIRKASHTHMDELLNILNTRTFSGESLFFEVEHNDNSYNPKVREPLGLTDTDLTI